MLTREFDKSSLPHITAVTLFNHSLVCDMQAIFFKGDDSVYPTYLLLTSYNYYETKNNWCSKHVSVKIEYFGSFKIEKGKP